MTQAKNKSRLKQEGQALKLARGDVSQVMFAQALRVSRAKVANWETGRSEIPRDVYSKYCEDATSDYSAVKKLVPALQALVSGNRELELALLTVAAEYLARIQDEAACSAALEDFRRLVLLIKRHAGGKNAT